MEFKNQEHKNHCTRMSWDGFLWGEKPCSKCGKHIPRNRDRCCFCGTSSPIDALTERSMSYIDELGNTI